GLSRLPHFFLRDDLEGVPAQLSAAKGKLQIRFLSAGVYGPHRYAGDANEDQTQRASSFHVVPPVAAAFRLGCRGFKSGATCGYNLSDGCAVAIEISTSSLRQLCFLRDEPEACATFRAPVAYASGSKHTKQLCPRSAQPCHA